MPLSGEYALVASQGGAPDHRPWYHNLKTHPRVELQDEPERHDYAAREVTGAKRDAWCARAVESLSPTAEYQQNTDREIPVFVLNRVD